MAEKSVIKISVRSLVEFILRSGDLDNRRNTSADREAMQKGSRLHRKIQNKMEASYRAEVPLSYRKEYENFDILIEGRADGIIQEPGFVVIDEIKGIYMDLDRLEEPVPVHMAQAKCYAWFYAVANKEKAMGVQMTYANLETEEIRRFREEFSYKELETWFDQVMADYYRWAEFEYNWRNTRNESMTGLEFPFPYREGQKEVVSSVYRAIQAKKNFFIQAPTGVGKTMSTVFPAVRAVGEGKAEKIFYLTAKTITRTVAEEAFGILREKGLRYKVVTLTAKEKLCVCSEPDCNPVSCPRAKGHYDRVNDAVFDLLTTGEAYDRDTILQKAEQYNVCPFEMCLDLSLWVDAVICDYNYVFDPNVHLKRFFGDTVRGEYLFLIDEAHNLVERGRQMYSAAIYKEHILAAKRLVKPYNKKLERYLEKVNKLLLQYKRECETYEVIESAGDVAIALLRVMGEMENYMQERQKGLEKTKFDPGQTIKDEEGKALLEFYFEVRDFLNIYDCLGEDYVIYSELDEEGKFRIQLFCVNPSRNLAECMDKGVSSIFFSATLLPINYYKTLLSSPDDYAIYAKSPFDSDKRCLLIGRDVSSKYTRRGYEEYRKIAEYISHTAKAKTGNYIVFFPSYRLMEDVFHIYQDEFDDPDMDWIIQKPSMGEEQREIFLENFSEDNDRTLIGFCVMGGIFSEGIDLIGEKLIGAIIVGTGLPQISNEREILKSYYDEKGQNGFDYAYRFPGMNKVLQSAGRVIRTKEDTGVILLLDERFLSRDYKGLFPVEWDTYHACTMQSVSGFLQEFWEEDVDGIS